MSNIITSLVPFSKCSAKPILVTNLGKSSTSSTIFAPNDNNYIINNTGVHRYENVINYNYENCKPILNIETKIFPDTTNQLNYYFIFDCPGKDAIGHWVYESFMFFSLYSELKKQHPMLQILTPNKKKYVKLLLRFFDLDDNIIYMIDNTQKNICFFPPIISKNILTDNVLFKKYIDIYANSIKNRLVILPQKNKYLFLPRNTFDNYDANDRTIPVTDEIRKNIVEKGGTVLNSFELNNLTFQYNIVNNSDIIIVDYGGSFVFNCIFLENKKIILLHNDNLNFYLSFQANKILFDYINERNNLVFVNFEPTSYISFEHNIQIHLD